jgi:hypothetical protein
MSRNLSPLTCDDGNRSRFEVFTPVPMKNAVFWDVGRVGLV